MTRKRLLTPVVIAIHLIAIHLVAAWLVFSDGSSEHEPKSQSIAWVGREVSREGGTSSGEQAPLTPGEIPTPTAEDKAAFAPPGELNFNSIEDIDGQLVADLGAGWSAELTLDPKLQTSARQLLDRGRVPLGAIVILDPKTGDLLAMADRLNEGHESLPKLPKSGPPHLALRAFAPAASVFKLVTAAGLLEKGVKPDLAYCYEPATRHIGIEHLEQPPDGAPCTDLGQGLSQSNNGIFARLSHKYLTRQDLGLLARRFGFNQVIPFAALTDASSASVPNGAVERARMASGFWHTKLTPLHGALIAAAIANDGAMPAPRLVARLRNPVGEITEAPSEPAFAKPLTPEIARLLGEMMAKTTQTGTGSRAFRRHKELEKIAVAGKTGSLSAQKPFVNYTWFVGFAPLEDPQIAFAVLVGNGPLWHVRAADIAAELVSTFFSSHEQPVGG